MLKTMELIFEIRDAEEGGYCARALGHSIFTEADTWDDLRANLIEAVSLHFEDAARSRAPFRGRSKERTIFPTLSGPDIRPESTALI